MFQKILIANRGEIACRVIRTARRMGLDTVAVFSDADRTAMHVAMADEAVHIGGSAASDSYLRGDRIIDAAKRTGAEAIHPGYGFLSENPDFVDAVEASGLVFIGPSASAIRAMGLKDAAKALMEKANVPIVPGYHGEAQDHVVLAGKATEIGYPVLIKARAGGGGKGMRLVKNASAFGDALSAAKSEAESSFGDSRVLVEKYVSSPRHIEVQVFGDNHGNTVYLFERDCSLQRRHQKVIEEAPAPGMTGEMRAAMGEAAVQAAQAIGYSGAGTVEFIVDASEGLRPDRFFFMEMNTRLQVEHPVTEMVTGLDLVEWQLHVAAGGRLPLGQDDLAIDGWAFEARIYAEDAAKGFIPATGTLQHLVFPESARVDSGVRSGDRITPFYDPMIAKIVVHGPNRNEALSRMASALRRTEIAGTVTNVDFLEKLARHAGFRAGNVDTGLIERDLEILTEAGPANAMAIAFAAMAALGLDQTTGSADPFDTLGPWAHWTKAKRIVHLDHGGLQIDVSMMRQSPKLWKAAVTGPVEAETVELDICLEHASDGRFTVNFGGNLRKARCVVVDNAITVFTGDATLVFGLPDEAKAADEAEDQGSRLYAPMPGVIKSVTPAVGASVKRGETLIVMEAMKLEMTLAAPGDGKIAEIAVKDGDQVSEGDVLILLETDSER